MSQTSRTSTNEHLQAIRVDVDLIRHALPPEAPDDEWPINDTMCDSILTHAAAMAARIERLQRLWDAWGRSRGYAADSKPYGAFLDALKACEDHGDLLPLDGSN